MSQSRAMSLVEVLMNLLVGCGVSYASNLVILPAMGFEITHGQAFEMMLYFTVISLVRGYIIRRWFNGFKFGGSK